MMLVLLLQPIKTEKEEEKKKPQKTEEKKKKGSRGGEKEKKVSPRFQLMTAGVRVWRTDHYSIELLEERGHSQVNIARPPLGGVTCSLQ